MAAYVTAKELNNGHVYVPRREQHCTTPEGDVLVSGTLTNKNACEGDTTVRVYTAAKEATCTDADGIAAG